MGEVILEKPFPRRKARGWLLSVRESAGGVDLVGTFSPGQASAWPASRLPDLLTLCFSLAIGFRGSGANQVRAVPLPPADVRSGVLREGRPLGRGAGGCCARGGFCRRCLLRAVPNEEPGGDGSVGPRPNAGSDGEGGQLKQEESIHHRVRRASITW